MKKINSKELAEINGGACVVWAIISVVGWFGMFLFAPFAILGVAGAGAYVICSQSDGGGGTVLNEPIYQ